MLFRLLLNFILFSAAVVPVSHAAPLKTSFCGEVFQRHSNLDRERITDWMSSGPEWAKANLAPEQLDEIKTYISVDELLKFRCAEYVPPPVQNPMPRSARGIKKQDVKGRKSERLSTHAVPLPPRKPI